MSSQTTWIEWVLFVVITIWIFLHILGTSVHGHLLRTTPHVRYGDWLRQRAPPPPTTPADVYVFIHVCNLGPWQNILGELMDCMRESDLYNVCTALFYGCSCLDCENVVTQTMQTRYRKAIALPTVPAPAHTHENWTINAVILFARSHPGCHILYLHTKGVTNITTTQRYWRRWMADYMIGLWRVCVRLLASGYHSQRTAYMHRHALPWRHRWCELRPDTMGETALFGQLLVGEERLRSNALVCDTHRRVRPNACRNEIIGKLHQRTARQHRNRTVDLVPFPLGSFVVNGSLFGTG